MTKEQIQEAYQSAEALIVNSNGKCDTKDLVNIGIQMALQGEVLYNEDGTIQRID